MKVAEIFSLGGRYGGGQGYDHDGGYHGGSYRDGYYGHRDGGELLGIRVGVGIGIGGGRY